jgi:hypothetical protein
MTSTRGNRLRSLLQGLAVSIALAPAAWAQGFGPDPFRPFNSQYDAYVYGTAPTSGTASLPFRSGVRGANQFENYLSELQGADRSRAENYGIGMPYYRRAVDPRFLRPDRDYVPNFKSNRAFEHTQERITEKYMAFFEERDPQKRAKLFNDYARAHASVSRLLATGRRNNASRVMEAAEEIVAPRRPPAARETPDAPPAPTRDTRRGATATNPDAERSAPRRSSTRAGDGAGLFIPPAPAPPRGLSGGRDRRAPSDVLDRARGLRDNDRRDLDPPITQPRPRRRPVTPPADPVTPADPGDR